MHTPAIRRPRCHGLQCLLGVSRSSSSDPYACCAIAQVLPNTPADLYNSSNISLPPSSSIIIGFNSGDSLDAPPFNVAGNWIETMDSGSYYYLIQKYFPTYHDKILQLYPIPGLHGETPGRQYLNINADLCVKCPLQKMAQQAP